MEVPDRNTQLVMPGYEGHVSRHLEECTCRDCAGRFTAMGKEVLFDGKHYGDMLTPEAATNTARALNAFGGPAIDSGEETGTLFA